MLFNFGDFFFVFVLKLNFSRGELEFLLMSIFQRFVVILLRDSNLVNAFIKVLVVFFVCF